jgi:hypothetical protein
LIKLKCRLTEPGALNASAPESILLKPIVNARAKKMLLMVAFAPLQVALS